MIVLIPTDANKFKKENLKFIRKVYEKTDLRFIFSGIMNYDEFYKDLSKEDLEFVRKNCLIIKNEKFDLNDCLRQFINYNQHLLKDTEKIALLEDDVVISITKNGNSIKSLGIDDILLISIYEEKLKNQNYNYLYFQDSSSIVTSIFLSFNSRLKKEELILKDVSPIFSFKYLKKLIEDETLILFDKKTVIENLINLYSLNIRKKFYSGIKLSIYPEKNYTLSNIDLPEISERKTTVHKTNIIIPDEIKNEIENKKVLNFIFEDNLTYNVCKSGTAKIWDVVISMLNNSNKYMMLISGEFPFMDLYKSKTAAETWRNVLLKNNNEYQKLKKYSILNIGMLNENMIKNIDENRPSYLLSNLNNIYSNKTNFKKIIFQQDEYNMIKLFKYNDNDENLFVSPYFSKRNDTPINIYENIKRILILI